MVRQKIIPKSWRHPRCSRCPPSHPEDHGAATLEIMFAQSQTSMTVPALCILFLLLSFFLWQPQTTEPCDPAGNLQRTPPPGPQSSTQRSGRVLSVRCHRLSRLKPIGRISACSLRCTAAEFRQTATEDKHYQSGSAD